MDKTEPQDKVISGHEQERADDSNLDCIMRLFADGIPKISIENWQIDAADIEVVAALSV